MSLGPQLPLASLGQQIGMRSSSDRFSGRDIISEDFNLTKALNSKVSLNGSDGKSESGISCSVNSMGDFLTEATPCGDLQNGMNLYGARNNGCESLLGAFFKF